MAGVTAAATAVTAALRTQNAAPVEEQVFRNNRVMPLFPMVDMTGGTTYNWRNQYAGNTSVDTYEEGDAVGEAGSQSYLQASAPVQYYKFTFSITGHAMDQIRGGADSAVFFDPWAREYSDGLRDLVDKVSTDMLGTGLTAPTGLQGWIDSSGTIAGILRSTYTWFAAYEDNAAGTTIAIADLNTHDYIVRDAERGGMINLWITSPKQKAKWAAVCGFIGASGNSLNIQVGANGATFNSGWNWDGAKHGNAPIVDVPDLTNSVWLGLTTEHWLIARQRAVSVVQLGIMGDQVKFLVTCAYGLVCRSPKKQAKILNLTA